MLKRLLFALLVLTFIVSVPCELNAASKKNRRTEKKIKKRDHKNKRNIEKNKPSGRLNSENPRETFDALLTSVQASKELSYEHKQILRSCLMNLSKTPTGRYIFSNIPYNITLHIIPNPEGQGAMGTYNHGHRKACFSDYLLRRASNAKSKVKKQEAILRFTTVIAHELTHATQGHLQLGICPEASYEDYATLRKFREVHALLEEQCAETELLNLPDFSEVRKKREQTGELNVFLRRAQDLQIKAGMSPAQARRFARTEFVRSFWSNTPNTPVRVGEEILYPSFVGPSQPTSIPWSISYNGKSFGYARRLGEDYYTKTKGTDIRRELNDTLKTIGLDLTADFVMQKKSFDFEKGRLIGYLDGVKQLEIDALGKNGRVVKRFEQGKLCSFRFETRDKDGFYTDYFYGKRTPRATYTIININGKPSGVYREYNSQGQQIYEIPIKAGKGNGRGWILENGRRVPKVFSNGVISERTKLIRSPYVNSNKYWQHRYMRENKKGSSTVCARTEQKIEEN